MSKFMFATGIENSYPTIPGPDGKKIRVDEMRSTRHYECWREDFELVTELGIEFLRYGPPYYSTHLGPGKYDWSFADETLHVLKKKKIKPILDLCHFGVPDWIGDFQNPEWPKYFAEYARAFAARYPWITLYTPINEIFVTAAFSAQYGWWNECLQSDRAFVTALKHCCQANVLAMHAIAREQPKAFFIQSESSEYFHAEDPSCIKEASLLNQKRFLSLDLIYGQPLNVSMYEYLLENGMTRDEYHWFSNYQMKYRCIMGNDYYIANEHMVHPNGSTSPSGEIFGYYVITSQYFRRYRLPIMHTETNIPEPDAVPWLRKEWANMHRLKEDGVPVVGFTWYSLQDQTDWDSALREVNGTINECGLVGLDRKIHPVGYAYKKLIEEWRDILPTESTALSVCP